MGTEFQYECDRCGKKQAAPAEPPSTPPDCCGHPMTWGEKLPVCGVSVTAEHTRIDDMGEPCDDGRGGVH